MNFNIFSKNFSFVAIGKTVTTILQAAFFLIFAAILEPVEYGNLSYLISIAATASIISRFGLNQSVTIYQAKKIFHYQTK